MRFRFDRPDDEIWWAEETCLTWMECLPGMSRSIRGMGHGALSNVQAHPSHVITKLHVIPNWKHV